jgi:ferric-dicitrate binding protein FerR (iron transport regulator)
VNEFERVGERVAEGLGGVSDDRYDAVRVAFLKQAPAVTRRHRKRRSLVILVGVAIVGLAGAAGWQFWLRSERASAQPNVEDLWLEGPKSGAPTRVDLGAGAHVDLVAGTRARVYRNGGGRTRVTLEGGAIDVVVGTEGERSWSFLAGPYLAQATRGEFLLSYQPASGMLEAGVTSGALHLSGGQLGADSVQLARGQRLRAGEGSVVVGGLNDP